MLGTQKDDVVFVNSPQCANNNKTSRILERMDIWENLKIKGGFQLNLRVIMA